MFGNADIYGNVSLEEIEMGYALVTSNCFGCKKLFMYNPIHVPSITVDGQREPVCLTCVERVNPMRKANGLEPIKLHPEAYEPVSEYEL